MGRWEPLWRSTAAAAAGAAPSGDRGLRLPRTADSGWWSACVGMRRATAPIRWTCIAIHPSSLVVDAQCLEAQLLSLFDTHLLALHQRRKMRAILSLGGCSRTAPCWADTAVQLVRPQTGGRQWSWQLRWRAFGCAERCRSSQQHRSSLGAALDVFVCLGVLVDVVVVVELRRWLPMVNLYL